MAGFEDGGVFDILVLVYVGVWFALNFGRWRREILVLCLLEAWCVFGFEYVYLSGFDLGCLGLSCAFYSRGLITVGAEVGCTSFLFWGKQAFVRAGR